MSNMKKAFSLVEAMIILMLISVAIMAIVPLISQKSSTTGIQTFKGRENDNDFMIFGKSPKQKIGIGVNPNSVAGINAKLYANNIGINYSNTSNAIFIGRNFNIANTSPYSLRATANDAISIGQNTCTNANGTISIGSQDAIACATNNFFIGQNSTTNITSNGANNFSLNVNGQELIKLNGDDFTISHYNTAGTPAIPIFNYTNGDKTFRFAKDVKIGNTGTGVLYLTATKYNAASALPDDPKSSYSICKDETCSDGNTYETHAKDNLHLNVSSDKRLKNVIANYNKGINDLNKIDTYTYTYKDDKKKSLQVGLIAQKIVGIFDEALHVDAKGFYSYERTPILYAMVNSVKNISHRLDVLSIEQKSLNSRADKLLKMYK